MNAPPKKSADKASMVSLAGNLTGQFLRLASNIIVTHMLVPSAYGIMGLVGAVLMGLQLLSDMGTQVAIVQNPKGDDRDFLNTAWTIEILRGTAVLVVGCAVAVPFSLFYHEEILAALIPTAALQGFIMSFLSSKMHQQRRHLDLTRNVIIDLTGQIVGFSSTIVHAYYYHSVWSLITGPLVQQSWRVLMSHLFIPGPFNRFRWHAESARAIRRTGRWITVSSGIMFLAQRLDVFLLGALTTMEELGVYNISMVLALFPMTLAGPVVNQVLLPALSAAHRESHEKLIASLNQARRAVLPVGMLAVLGLAVFAPPFFMILYDQRYQDAQWITQLYMAVSWFQFLTEAFGRALQAMDDAKTLAIGQATRLLTTAACAYAGYRIGGLPGFMMGNALAALAMYAVIVRKLRVHGLANIGADVKFTLIGASVAIASTFAARWAVAHVDFPAKWVWVGVGIVFYVPVALISSRGVLAQMRELKRQKAARAPVAAPAAAGG